MNIVSVIPISRGIGVEELTYFTSEEVTPGQLVSVPLRKKDVPALVVSVRDASKEKALLKKADFSLKKVSYVHTTSPLTPTFLSAVALIAEYYATTLGSVIEALTPKHILTDPPETTHKQKTTGGEGFHKMLLQDIPEERAQYYKALVRETFAKKSSVLLVVPTVYQVAEYAETLGKGIASYVISAHSGMSKKKIQEVWERCMTEEHPVLIVTTPGFLSVPRSDVGIIICEDESSRHYFSSTRPYVDARVAARFLAKALNATYLSAGTVVQSETRQEYSSGEIEGVRKPKNRFEGAPISIADMRYDEDVQKPAIISDVLKEALIQLKEGQRAFIFVSRRGLSPLLRCRDCGTVKVCSVCSSPLALHNERERLFHCHRCGEKYSVSDKCTECGGWRIDQLGIATGTIERELLALHLSVPLIRIDSDTTTTPAQVRKTAERWHTEGGVLVGTEMALPFISAGVEWSAVASMDALFALPHFRIQERLFDIVLALRLYTEQQVLVQTRVPDHKLFDLVGRGDMQGLYTYEWNIRKTLGYPPFMTLVQITRRGTEHSVIADMQKIQSVIYEWKPMLYSGFHTTDRGKYVLHALIKIEPDRWPDERLVGLLRSLPPTYEVRINPDSIF